MALYLEKEGHARLRMLEKAISKLEKADTRNKLKHRRRRVLGLLHSLDNSIKKQFKIPDKEKKTKEKAEEALRLMIKRFAKTYNTSWHPEKGAVSRLGLLTNSLDYIWYHVKPTDDLMAAIILPIFKRRFERWQVRYRNVIILEKIKRRDY